MQRVLVIFAHPAYHKSQANQQLIAAISTLDGVDVHDIYQLYPNGIIDTLAEQRLLQDYDILVFQHPFYWYSAPALLKEWMDHVLTQTYMYPRQNMSPVAIDKLLTVITCGGSLVSYQSDGYNRHDIRDFLLPFQQTAVLCGMEYLPPFVVDGVHKNGDRKRLSAYAEQYRQVLIALRDETLDRAHFGDFLSTPISSR